MSVSRKIKVAFVGFTKLTEGAGTETFLLNIAKYVPVSRFDVSFFQTDYRTKDRLTDQNVSEMLSGAPLYTMKSFLNQIESLQSSKNRFVSRLFKGRFQALLLTLSTPFYRFVNAPIIKRVINSDIVYLVRNLDSDNLRCDRKKSLIVGSTHCSLLKTRLTRTRFLKDIPSLVFFRYRNIDCFHLLTKKIALEADVRRKYDFLIPNGVDTNLFHPDFASLSGNTIKFLFVGRLLDRKGIQIVLKAFSAIPSQECELHIVGRGPLEAEVQRSSTEDNRIFYHGGVSMEELGKIYRMCDIFVFPTEREIFGIVVLEAAASGLYVIGSTTQVGIFDDLKSLGALEYADNDHQIIRGRMMEAARNIKEIRNHKGAAYDFVKKNYDWQVVSTNLFNTLEQLYENKFKEHVASFGQDA